MKTIKFLLIGLLFYTSLAQAQVAINVNLASPPTWGPAGYSNVRYYYLPDIATYYDVGTRQYIYLSDKKWVRARTLPAPYRSYNLYNGYKVVLKDYKGTAPYVLYTQHRVKYPKGYKVGTQKTIGVPPGLAKKGVVVHPGRAKKAHPHSHGGHKHKHKKD